MARHQKGLRNAVSRRTVCYALLLSLILISILWQFLEVQISLGAEAVAARLTGKPFNQVQILDEQGIPVQIYQDGTRSYNPLFIARDAQLEYASDTPRFDALIAKLMETMVVTDSTAFAPYDFDYPKYSQTAPWYSALTQAVVMNAFALAAEKYQNPAYQDLAEKLIHTLQPGRLTYALPDSSLWFMEYPASPPYFSLSGMISTLRELNEYYQLTKDERALELFDRGYKAVIQKLPEYDYHGYSYYNLRGVKVGRLYHNHHIQRLKELIAIRPHPLLEYYHERWQKADRLPVLWQFIVNPRPKRIVGFLGTWLMLFCLCYFCLRLWHR